MWPLTTKDFNTLHNFLNQLWQLRLCSNDPIHIAGVMDYGSTWFFSYLALPHLHRQQECRHARRTKLPLSRQQRKEKLNLVVTEIEIWLPVNQASFLLQIRTMATLHGAEQYGYTLC
jgi:hypothetical protein